MINQKEIQQFLDNRSDKNEKIISDAMLALENKIISLTSMIETKKNGNIVGPSKSLAQARAMEKEINKAFDEIFMPAVEATLNYSDVDNLIVDYFK